MTAARSYRWYFAVMMAALVAVSLSWSPAEAKKKKKKKSVSQKVLFVNTDFGITYDDNIIRYSDADLDLYDVSPDTGVFSIDSKNDWIITPKIESRVKGKFIDGRTAWLGLYFNYYHYVQNDVRRFVKIGAFGRHYYRRGGYFEIDYYYIPDYYYRNQTYLNSFVEASFSKHSLTLATGADIASSIKAEISYRYQSKAFNAEVSERDLKVNGFKLDGVWKMSNSLKFWATYGLESASAAGADNPDLTVKDVSYDAWDITLGSRYYTRLLGKVSPEFSLSAQIREIKYQTSKYVDNYRFGRKDHNRKYTAGATWHLPQKVQFDMEYTYLQKQTDLLTPALEGALEYTANSITFSLKRNF